MDATDVERTILDIKGRLEAKDPSITTLTDVLTALSEVDMTVDLLQSTKIGLAVGAFRKHEADAVRTKARTLIRAWKSLAGVGGGSGDSGSRSSSSAKKAAGTPLSKGSGGSGNPITPTAGGAFPPSTPTAMDSAPTPPGSPAVTDAGAPPPSTTSTDASGPASPSAPAALVTSTDSTAAPGEDGPVPPTTPRAPSASDIPQTETKLRNTFRKFILEGLSKDLDSNDAGIDLIAVTVEVEDALYAAASATGNYKDRGRAMSTALKAKSNPGLRQRVRRGIISPAELAAMGAAEMASPELQVRIAKAEKQADKDGLAAKNPEASTDQFRCGRCKKRQCTFRQQQTRSADEPMTTFVTCVNCGNRWKFC